MTNNKWIVPIVAIVLCAVSLIGAGYAAYTATLSSSENVAVENDYTILEFDSYTIADDIFVEFNSDTTFSAPSTYTTTYQALESVQDILTFSVDTTKQYGTVDTVDAITATIAFATGGSGELGTYFDTVNLSISEVSNNSFTPVTANNDGSYTLDASKTYAVILTLDDAKSAVSTAPSTSSYNITYELVISDTVSPSA